MDIPTPSTDSHDRTGYLPVISLVTLAVVLVNAWGLAAGITTVLPHLFYIPIVLVAYFYPRRGILFALALSVLYLAIAGAVGGFGGTDIVAAVGRTLVFILIAAVVSFLTQRMRESEALFRGVAERSSDIIILTDISGRATYVSPSVVGILGYDPAEITGKMPGMFIHPDDMSLLEKAFPESTSGILAGEVQVRFQKKDGDYACIAFFGAPIIRDGIVSGIQVIGRDVTGRKQAEDALRESEEKYRTLADYTYDWEYWISPDETMLYTTPSCERITGYTPKEFSTDKDLIRRIIYPDDRAALDHHMSHASDGDLAEAIDFRIRHRNGETRWIAHVCQPVHNARGEFTGRRASNRDITSRKRAEEELRDTNRRLADIIDFLPDPTFVIDADGIVVAWNRAMEELTRIPASSILGEGNYAYAVWFYKEPRSVLIDLVLRGDLDGIKKLYPRYRHHGNTIRAEAETLRPDGTPIQFWLTATPLLNPDGETIGAIESLRDVTQQKAMARASKESKKYLDAIINTISDPVFVKDRKHCFVTVNDGFCDFIGQARESLLGKSDYDFFNKAEADTFWEMDEVVFRTREINENEESLTDSTGTRHTIVTKKSLYADQDGNEFIVGIIRDITDRKRTEMALHEANRKLNLLSSITRHDIRNQLLSLTAYLELSKETLGDAAITSGYIIKEERAAHAIERQILFTKEYEDLGVNAPVWEMVSSCVKNAVAALPVRDIQVVAETDGLEVYADPLFGKVFYNLIDNALRYGGQKMTMIRVFPQDTGGGLVLSLEDDGAGISAEDKERLFERGFGHHTGLGLFLSREILSITGITITETSEAGKGARFEILVPKGGWRMSAAEK
jgi:PAS domain S-box-containing protein